MNEKVINEIHKFKVIIALSAVADITVMKLRQGRSESGSVGNSALCVHGGI